MVAKADRRSIGRDAGGPGQSAAAAHRREARRRRDYVSHLAREIGISRPLLHMHLQRLEAAGLIVGSLELSDDGKAMKYFAVTDFNLHLTATLFAEAASTLTQSDPQAGPARKERP